MKSLQAVRPRQTRGSIYDLSDFILILFLEVLFSLDQGFGLLEIYLKAESE